MEQKDLPIINLTVKELKDIKSFCSLKDLKFGEFIDSCFNKGYQIEKYGLLTTDDGKQIIFEEKEIIKEVIVEVEKIVEKEIIVEVEKPVRVIVEKEVYITDDDEINKLSVRYGKLEELKIGLESDKVLLDKKILYLNRLLDEKPQPLKPEQVINYPLLTITTEAVGRYSD
jgi:hypothetical protein